MTTTWRPWETAAKAGTTSVLRRWLDGPGQAVQDARGRARLTRPREIALRLAVDALLRGRVAGHEHADDRDLLGEDEDRVRGSGRRLRLRVGVGSARDDVQVVEQLAGGGQVAAGRLGLRGHGSSLGGRWIGRGQGVVGAAVAGAGVVVVVVVAVVAVGSATAAV